MKTLMIYHSNPDKQSGNPDKQSGNPDKQSGNPDKQSGNPDKQSGNPDKHRLRFVMVCGIIILSIIQFWRCIKMTNDDQQVSIYQGTFRNSSNFACSYSASGTMEQRKLMDALKAKAQECTGLDAVRQNTNFEFTISLDYIRERLDMPYQTRKEIIAKLEDLQKIIFKFNLLSKYGKEYVSCVFLSKFRIGDDDEFKFIFGPDVQDWVIHPEHYARVDLNTIAKLKGSRSVELYEFLIQYANFKPGSPKITIQQMREILGMSEDEYLNFCDFKKRVLDNLRDDMRNYNLDCSYELIKCGGKNKYAYIKWYVKYIQTPEYIKASISKKAKIEIPDVSKSETPEPEKQRPNLHLSYKSSDDDLDEDWKNWN